MRHRCFAAVVAAAGLFVPVAWLLRSPVFSETVQPLTTSRTATSIAVEVPELAYLRKAEQASLYRVMLFAARPSALASHSEIRLLVATFGTSPTLDRGEMYFEGTDCVFTTPPHARFANNDYLTFTRGHNCADLSGSATGYVRVTFRFETFGRVAAWVEQTEPSHSGTGELELVDRAIVPKDVRYALRGLTADINPSLSATRVALLTYVWEIAGSSDWVWLWLCVDAALVGLAAAAFAGRGSAAFPRGRLAIRVGLGSFCAAAALASLYAVVVPPFQAADEPSHFMGFAAFIKRPNTYEEASLWARRTHFERLQFHPEQHFTPADRGVLGPPWDDGGGPDIESRGIAIKWLWGQIPDVVRRQPLQRLLLALRLINAFVFAVAVGTFTVLVTLLTNANCPELVALPLFLIPTLPFFGTTVSNYAPLVGAYVLVACGTLLHVRGDRGANAAGAVIVAGWILAVLLSRSALPLTPLVVAVLASRIFTNGGDSSGSSVLVFWGGTAAASIVGLRAADPAYLGTLWAAVSGALPGIASNGSVSLLVIAAMAAALAASGGLFEWLFVRAAKRMRSPAVDRVTRALLRAVAILTLILLVSSAVTQFPTVPRTDLARPPTPAHYVQNVLAAAITPFRLKGHDVATSTSFWGGFGWLDTIPPSWLITILSAATGIALAALLLQTAGPPLIRKAVALGFLFIGWVASIACYAYAIIAITPADVHGRYLIGLDLSVLVVIWSVVSDLAESRGGSAAPIIRAVAGTACLCIHVISVGVILVRYF